MIKIDKTQITLNKDTRHKNTLNEFVCCLFDYARLASSFRVIIKIDNIQITLGQDSRRALRSEFSRPLCRAAENGFLARSVLYFFSFFPSIRIDSTQITLNEDARGELRSTSNQSSEPCEVAQYP